MPENKPALAKKNSELDQNKKIQGNSKNPSISSEDLDQINKKAGKKARKPKKSEK